MNGSQLALLSMVMLDEDQDEKLAQKAALVARVEEFYNKHHQQSGEDGGEFVEGPDGPGRKRDAGTEDLGKDGTNQPKKPSVTGRTTVSVKLQGRAGSMARAEYLKSKGIKEDSEEWSQHMAAPKGSRISVKKTAAPEKKAEEPEATPASKDAPAPAMEKKEAAAPVAKESPAPAPAPAPAAEAKKTVSVGLRGNAKSSARKAFLDEKGLKEGTPEYDKALTDPKGTRIRVPKTEDAKVEAEAAMEKAVEPAPKAAPDKGGTISGAEEMDGEGSAEHKKAVAMDGKLDTVSPEKGLPAPVPVPVPTPVPAAPVESLKVSSADKSKVLNQVKKYRDQLAEKSFLIRNKGEFDEAIEQAAVDLEADGKPEAAAFMRSHKGQTKHVPIPFKAPKDMLNPERANDSHMLQKRSEVEAENKHSRRFLDNLSKQEQEAVDSYVGANTVAINDCIGRGKGCTAALKKDAKIMREVIAQAPVRDMTTYRGIVLRGVTADKLAGKVDKLYQPGKEVSMTDGGFQSGSTDIDVSAGYAKGDGGDVVFEITGRQRAAPVSGNEPRGSEAYLSEVVFDPDARFRVIEVFHEAPVRVREHNTSDQPGSEPWNITIVRVEQILDDEPGMQVRTAEGRERYGKAIGQDIEADKDAAVASVRSRALLSMVMLDGL